MFERHPSPPLYDIVRLGGGLHIPFCVPLYFSAPCVTASTEIHAVESERVAGARGRGWRTT